MMIQLLADQTDQQGEQPAGSLSASRARSAILGCVLLATGLRLPFIRTGVGMDEGGYAYVAQQWASGKRLYDTAWIDRPQGLMLAYRFLLWLGSGGWTIRLAAVVAGATITGLLGIIGWLLLGRAAGVIAAAVYAVVGIAPHLEGFTFNGELAASVPAIAAIAAVLWWRRSSSRPVGWLIVGGIAAGTAVTMKQSGVDGIVTGLAVIAVSSARRDRGAGIFLASAALPISASMVHGALTGWHRYWQALVGYQLGALGGPEAGIRGRLHAFIGSLPRVWTDLILLVLAALVGLYLIRRSAAFTVVCAWLAAAIIGVNVGGSYWPHYYVQALPPLVVAATAAIVALRTPRARMIGAAALMASTMVWLIALVPATPAQRQHEIPYYHRALRDEQIAAAITQITRPTDRIFIIESEANIYWLSQRTAAYPYIWAMPISKIPDAVTHLQNLLGGPHRPALIGVQSSPDGLDPSGTLDQLLATWYEPTRTIDGMTLYRLRRATTPDKNAIG